MNFALDFLHTPAYVHTLVVLRHSEIIKTTLRVQGRALYDPCILAGVCDPFPQDLLGL